MPEPPVRNGAEVLSTAIPNPPPHRPGPNHPTVKAYGYLDLGAQIELPVGCSASSLSAMRLWAVCVSLSLGFGIAASVHLRDKAGKKATPYSIQETRIGILLPDKAWKAKCGGRQAERAVLDPTMPGARADLETYIQHTIVCGGFTLSHVLTVPSHWIVAGFASPAVLKRPPPLLIEWQCLESEAVELFVLKLCALIIIISGRSKQKPSMNTQ